MKTLKILVVSFAVLFAGGVLAAPYENLPLMFERNEGQTDAAVRFAGRGQGYGVYLTQDAAVLSLSTPDGRNATLRMRLVGGAGAARITGESPLAATSNYFLGSNTHTSVANFASVRYAEVYGGVDLIFRGNRRQLEYDFVLAPHAAPERIRLEFDGAESISVGADGALVLHTAGGDLVQPRPVLYQVIEGQRVHVDGGYELFPNGHVGFEVGRYDREQTLVIDPVLVYSTFLGGASLDEGLAIAVDAEGSAYVTGLVESLSFPGVDGSSMQPANGGGYDAFVTKINAAGTAILYSTFLGGNGGSEYGMGIAVDAGGNAYVTGGTNSTNFPSSSTSYLGGPRDAFIAKLDATGSSLAYSMLFGSAGDDLGQAIAIDAFGNAYVAGASDGGAFATKIDPTGKTFVYSAPLAGAGVAIAVDGTGTATVAGTSGADAFVAKLNATGQTVFSTLLGGAGVEEGMGLAIDGTGNAYVTGYTDSTAFPGVTSGALQPVNGGGYDNFLSKVDANGAIVYSTFLGGADTDFPTGGVALDGAGNIWLAGATVSTNFPGMNANSLQSTFAGTADAFVTQLDSTGTQILYSTYFGGEGDDEAMGLAIDASNNVYVTGWTGSTNFPITSAVQPVFGGGWLDGFILKLAQ